MSLVVREMAAGEADLIVDYFHGSTPEHLELLGVDPMRLPMPQRWRERFLRDFAAPVRERSAVFVIWELDGAPIGFSTADKIVYGEQARTSTSSTRSAAGPGSGRHVCARRSHSISGFWRWNGSSASPTPSTSRRTGPCRRSASSTSRPT